MSFLSFPQGKKRNHSEISSSILQENGITPKVPIISKKEVEKNNVWQKHEMV